MTYPKAEFGGIRWKMCVINMTKIYWKLKYINLSVNAYIIPFVNRLIGTITQDRPTKKELEMNHKRLAHKGKPLYLYMI